MKLVKYRVDITKRRGFSPDELARLDALTEAEITAAALSDPDNPPLTELELQIVDDTNYVRSVRRGTGLSQAQFAQAYRISPGRLRDLEQGRTRPDSALRAYFMVIAQRPDIVTACLAS